MSILNYNLILSCDSYKLSHQTKLLYPEGTTGLHSYIEARIKDNITIIPFGLQMWIKKNLLTPITLDNILEAKKFAKEHGEPFNQKAWEYILNKYNGFLPITIKGIPEGTPVNNRTAIVTVECTDPEVFWLASSIETNLQRGIWYPTTIASNDHKNYNMLKSFYDKFSDNLSMLSFALHDFGARGVSSEETAEIGGAAHLIYFTGSDTISGVRAANYYYNSSMSAFSVPATEHSIQCSYGPNKQEQYLKTVLDLYAKPNAIVSIVLDGYDVFRESELLCTKFKDQIVKSGAKVVFRPDSGDAKAICTRILMMQEKAFGYTLNSKGMKVINNVGIIQGDGVDYQTMFDILTWITDLGYAPENIIFGSGGSLLQKVNRDTFSFAQKVSAILIDGNWVDVFKDPITDKGKKSKTGKQTTDQMITFYENGKLLVNETLETIRKRAKNDY